MRCTLFLARVPQKEEYQLHQLHHVVLSLHDHLKAMGVDMGRMEGGSATFLGKLRLMRRLALQLPTGVCESATCTCDGLHIWRVENVPDRAGTQQSHSRASKNTHNAVLPLTGLQHGPQVQRCAKWGSTRGSRAWCGFRRAPGACTASSWGSTRTAGSPRPGYRRASLAASRCAIPAAWLAVRRVSPNVGVAFATLLGGAGRKQAYYVTYNTRSLPAVCTLH